MTLDTSPQIGITSDDRAVRALATLAETMPVFVFVVDLTGRTAYANNRWLEYIDRAAHDIADIRPVELIHPDDFTRWRAGLDRVVAEPGELRLEVRLRRADGEYRWHLAHVGPHRNAANERDGWIATGIDIHDRKLVEESLLANEARYRALTDALPSIISTCDPGGRIGYFNDRWYEYTGLGEEESLAAGWSTAMHPDDYSTAIASWQRSMLSGEPFECEGRIRGRDGAYRWHLARMEPIRTNGEISGWVLAALDIDDRKQTDAYDRYLADTTAKMLSPLDSEPLLKELARLTVPAFADICSIGLFDGGPATVRVETASDDDDALRAAANIHLRRWRSAPGSTRTINDVIMSGEPVFVPEFSPGWISACSSDDVQRDEALALGGTSLMCVPLVARGETIGMATLAMIHSRRVYGIRDLMVMREVAARAGIAVHNARLFFELHAKAEELKRANAAKDEFLGLVSHELKTPITMIYGNAEVLRLRSEQIDSEGRRVAIEDISRGSERLHRVIDNLLVLARWEDGQRLTLEPLLLRRVIERVLTEYRTQVPAPRVTLNAPAELTPVAGEQLSVEHVLRNLLSNAAKYAPAGAGIEVLIRQEDDELLVSVLDEGCGFGEDEADLLFTPFFRSPGTAERVEGVGIGLAVCKRLIEAQGGRVWASRRPTGGSEFGFALRTVDE